MQWLTGAYGEVIYLKCRCSAIRAITKEYREGKFHNNDIYFINCIIPPPLFMFWGTHSFVFVGDDLV